MSAGICPVGREKYYTAEIRSFFYGNFFPAWGGTPQFWEGSRRIGGWISLCSSKGSSIMTTVLSWNSFSETGEQNFEQGIELRKYYFSTENFQISFWNPRIFSINFNSESILRQKVKNYFHEISLRFREYFKKITKDITILQISLWTYKYSLKLWKLSKNSLFHYFWYTFLKSSPASGVAAPIFQYLQ